jgi:phosphoribosylglycinamide formyltransferase 1
MTQKQSIPKLCVLISGGGTTLQNFIDQIQSKKFGAEIVGVVSSKPDAYGLLRAQKAHIPTNVVERKPKETFSGRVFDAVRAWKPDLVCLAGWLQLLEIPKEFEKRVLNIHPSYLPAFGGKGMYGLKVHQAVLDAHAKHTGCTVHFADNEYDTGPIIAQAQVPVLLGDTAESLAARVFAAECELYPAAITKTFLQKLNESR